jgi:hypothetical protein
MGLVRRTLGQEWKITRRSTVRLERCRGGEVRVQIAGLLVEEVSSVV